MRAILRCLVTISKQEYAARRERHGEMLDGRALDALFVPPLRISST
jgi:hypothetical protein